MATQPKHLTESKPDVRGRIDDEQLEEPATAAPDSPAGSSGSSISEEDEVHVPENHVPPAEDLERLALEGEHGDELTDEEDEEGSDSAEYDYEEEEEEWDPEDEDWDLLQGELMADFTKQYNRMRQLHAATGSNTQVAAPARNQPQTSSSSSAPPKAPGVAVNPKLLAEKHDKDKSDRATQEQVLDPRTRLVLAGLVNRGVIGKMDRCVSTGKEANVYHASSDGPFASVAVKIYRTSILAFRARQTYMIGEHRFRGEYTSSKNPRKMVRVWAEKELRNLKRLEQGGVPAPRVLEVKQNVLVMEFLGDEEASPRLKDAQVDQDELQRLYTELLLLVRRMFKVCRLVHADLSEYNLLYHRRQIYIIDVSQSVEEDHPRAFDFLRVDITNMEDCFARRGAKTLGPKRAWDFIVGDNHKGTGEVVEEWLGMEHDPADDAVFMASFIPRTLGQVYDPERDIELMKAGKGDQLIYNQTLNVGTAPEPAQTQAVAVSEGSETKKTVSATKQETGTAEPEVDVREHAGIAQPAATEHAEDAEAAGEGGSGGEESSEEEGDGQKGPRGFRHEDRDAKKERKKAVKEEKREKRKTKMPKAEKQRLMRKTARA